MAAATALARAMLEANALPSSLAHPARLEAWGGAGTGLWPRLREVLGRLAADTRVAGEGILHRHVSAALLRDPALGLGWIDSPEDPALALCAAPAHLFDSLQRHAGLVLLGPAIRQVIARAELAALEMQLGPGSLEFVRRQAPRLWAGGGGAPALRVEAATVSEQTLRWGAEVLARAFEAASPPVTRRGHLRLPPQVGREPLPAGLDEPHQALALARALLHELDAPWLSLFPASP